MRLVGRGKKGTNAVSPRKPRDPYSTGIFDPPGRIGRDRTHIAVRVCRDRNAAVASSPISEPREQARKAVDRCGHRQIELRRETLEHRLGDLTPRAGVVVENIPGGGDRAPQVRVTLDPVVGGPQALLARECDGKGRGIRGLDCAQPGDEALLVLDRDAVEALRRGLALGDILTPSCAPAGGVLPDIRA